VTDRRCLVMLEGDELEACVLFSTICTGCSAVLYLFVFCNSECCSEAACTDFFHILYQLL